MNTDIIQKTMGLIYQFPISSEDSYVQINKNLIIKSYGLPKIFWLYYLLFIVFYTTLCFLLWQPLMNLINVDFFLGWITVIYTLLTPLIPLFFFYYEKTLILNNFDLTIEKKVFFIFSRKNHLLEQLILRRFLDSPNYARIHKLDSSFQNKGYFILLGKNATCEFFIDRSSQGRDLLLLAQIFINYNKKLLLIDETSL